MRESAMDFFVLLWLRMPDHHHDFDKSAINSGNKRATMSTNSFKRFTVKARQSFSGLRPFLEGFDINETRESPFSDSKENINPELEEFGYVKTNTGSAASNSSPRDSPSRRKRLMTTLRSVSSLRSLRSPSSKFKLRGDRDVEPESPHTPKEKFEPRHDRHVEPESPHTPTRFTIRPSLTLNFEQSPADQPMFDLSRRSSSSSLVVHQSSPVPIPSPALQHQLRMRTVRASELPAGTVPKSPAPIQLALDSDKSAFEPVPCPVPAPMNTDPLPTPMPGTNVGFSKHDLTGENSNFMSVREGSGYFDFPVCDQANDVMTADLRQDSFAANPAAGRPSMTPTALDEVEKVRLYRRRTLSKCDHVHVEVNGKSHCVQRLCAPETLSIGAVHTEDLQHAADAADQCSSPINIEHVVFDDYPPVHADCQPMLAPSVSTEADEQVELQQQTHASRTSASQQRATENSPATPAANAWGTHASLYDGTGYGDSSSSSSPRPSTSYTMPTVPVELARSTVYAADSLAEDSAAMARDHETLEEVIRAYAAFEEEGACGMGESMIGAVVAEAQADAELAKSMADYSLGA